MYSWISSSYDYTKYSDTVVTLAKRKRRIDSKHIKGDARLGLFKSDIAIRQHDRRIQCRAQYDFLLWQCLLSLQLDPSSPPLQSTFNHFCQRSYSESANSARPALELRYSFLQAVCQLRVLKQCPIAFPMSSITAEQSSNLFQMSLPLSRPLHGLVSNQHRNGPVENLRPRPSSGVEDGRVCGAGKSALAIVGKTVGDNSLLCWGAYLTNRMSTVVLILLLIPSLPHCHVPRLPHQPMYLFARQCVSFDVASESGCGCDGPALIGRHSLARLLFAASTHFCESRMCGKGFERCR